MVAGALEYLVEEALADLGRGAWAKSRAQLAVQRSASSLAGDVPEASGASSSGLSPEAAPPSAALPDVRGVAGHASYDPSSHMELQVSRTFLSVLPTRREAATVNQSSTEAMRGR